jgi:rfaE bifunctional protein nucleotidyltransferase chain/domain
MADSHAADRAAALVLRTAAAAAGKRVVFTNGCFDIVHAGHTAYLTWARAQGDVLILGLNDDASVAQLKGELRPIVPFAQRRRVLEALRCVDFVVGFAESTPEYLLAELKPDIHVKSAQYRLDELPERAIVEAGGGRVVLAPHEVGLSTTDIIAKILASTAK